ncbi:tyrosine-type recombinase/integrase [Streptomyces sp. Je 1-332]|uniref:tyrosine-type recombinase/integrase n=1 Tax=Streptomyces sp. Je 1-332 TaxID=3231270 RepID=UPI00345A7C77
MAKFTPNPALEALLARMIAPNVQRIAHQVEVEAKRLAPPTKRWVTMADDKVRHTHIQAQGQVVPGNLRFRINSMDWHRKHRGVGPNTYMLKPRDQPSRAVANLKNCFPGDTLVSARGVRHVSGVGMTVRWSGSRLPKGASSPEPLITNECKRGTARALFWSARNNLVCRNHFNDDAWKPTLRKLGIKDEKGNLPTFHDLRHTFISTCLQNGIPEHTVAAWVGDSVEELRRTYSHLLRDHADTHGAIAAGLTARPSRSAEPVAA